MVAEQLRLRQSRTYSREPVPDEIVAELLQIARSSGSWANSQPWHFVVIRDRDTLRRISQPRPFMAWLADVPLAIAVVLDGAGSSQSYDDGRVTERLLIGAHMLGLGGGGTPWFGGDAEEAEEKPSEGGQGSSTRCDHPRTEAALGAGELRALGQGEGVNENGSRLIGGSHFLIPGSP